MNKTVLLFLLFLMLALLPARAKAAYPVLDGFNIYSSNGVKISGAGIDAVAVQPWDGMVVIGGKFTLTGSGTTRQNLARLNTDGTLDTTFNPAPNDTVAAIAINPDQSGIYIGGSFSAVGAQTRYGLARLDGGGTPDGFNPATQANTVVNAIVLQSGAILVGGRFTEMVAAPRGNIAGISSGGVLSASFPVGTNGDVNAILLQDKMIVLGGSFTSPQPKLARFDASGAFDGGFSAAPNDTVRSLALQADGKIVLGGDFTSITSTSGPQSRGYLARLSGDGTLEAFDPGANGYVTSIVLQPDGRILLGGDFTQIGPTTRKHVARLYMDGTLDKDADPHKDIDPNTDAVVNAIALQPDGKFLVGGNFDRVGLGLKHRTRLARFYPYGALDEDIFSFGPTITGGSALPLELSMLPNGMTTITGLFSTVLGSSKTDFVSLNPDWSLASEPNLAPQGPPLGLSPQPDGKLLVAGTTLDAMVRLDSSGNPDPQFNVPADVSFLTYCMVLLRPGTRLPDGTSLDDGMMYIGGDLNRAALLQIGTKNFLARIKKDGTRDGSFHPPDDSLLAGPAFYVAIQTDNKILVGTDESAGVVSAGRIMRLNTDGSLDTSFTVRALPGAIWSIALEPDGEHILVVGNFPQVLRLDKWGAIDNGFNFQVAGGADDVTSLALQADGGMTFTGQFASVNGVAHDDVAHILPTGDLDPDFNPGTFTSTAGPINKVGFVKLQSDGKLIFVGRFTKLNGSTARQRIVRFSNGWATQELSVSPDGRKVTWLRGGAGPELWRVSLEDSGDGVNWSYLGDAVRIPLPGRGWYLDGLDLGAGGWDTNRYLRARGYVTGEKASSGTIIESVRLYYLNQAQMLDQTIYSWELKKTYGDANFNPSANLINPWSATSGLQVTYKSSNPSVATIDGNGEIRITGAGFTSITASQGGNEAYNPAIDVWQTLTVDKKPLTVTADDKTRAYQAVNPQLTASYTGFVNGENYSTAAIQGNPDLWTDATPASSVGSYPVFAGPGNLAATNYGFKPANGTLSVIRSCQEIIFPPIGDRTFGDPPFVIQASACSGLGITFASSDPQVATISGNLLTITGAGVAVITASQGGSGDLDRAPSVSQTVIVHRSGQTVGFTSLARQVLGDPPFSLNATASSALPVSYRSSEASVAEINGSIVTLKGAGTTVITASQPGNGNYNAALPVSQTLTVALEGVPPLIALSTLPSGAVTANPVLNIMGVASDASGIASLTVNGADLTERAALFSSAVPLGVGENSIAVTAQDGAGNRTTETLSITLDGAAPEISLAAPADNSVTGALFFAASGTVTPGSAVTIGVNGSALQELAVTDGAFTGGGYLEQGVNTIELMAALSGRVSRVKRSVTLAPGRPSVAITEPVEDMRTEKDSITIRGAVGGEGGSVVVAVAGKSFSPLVQAGAFQQVIALDHAGEFRITASVTDTGGSSSVAQRNIIRVDTIMGDLNGDGCVDIRDAAAALRISLGIDQATGQALAHGDVAPLVDGVPRPDGKIDVGDLLVLLRKIVGLADF